METRRILLIGLALTAALAGALAAGDGGPGVPPFAAAQTSQTAQNTFTLLNTAPTAPSMAIDTRIGETVTINFNQATDPENDQLRFYLDSNPGPVPDPGFIPPSGSTTLFADLATSPVGFEENPSTDPENPFSAFFYNVIEPWDPTSGTDHTITFVVGPDADTGTYTINYHAHDGTDPSTAGVITLNVAGLEPTMPPTAMRISESAVLPANISINLADHIRDGDTNIADQTITITFRSDNIPNAVSGLDQDALNPRIFTPNTDGRTIEFQSVSGAAEYMADYTVNDGATTASAEMALTFTAPSTDNTIEVKPLSYTVPFEDRTSFTTTIDYAQLTDLASGFEGFDPATATLSVAQIGSSGGLASVERIPEDSETRSLNYAAADSHSGIETFDYSISQGDAFGTSTVTFDVDDGLVCTNRVEGTRIEFGHLRPGQTSIPVTVRVYNTGEVENNVMVSGSDWFDSAGTLVMRGTQTHYSVAPGTLYPAKEVMPSESTSIGPISPSGSKNIHIQLQVSLLVPDFEGRLNQQITLSTLCP